MLESRHIHKKDRHFDRSIELYELQMPLKRHKNLYRFQEFLLEGPIYLLIFLTYVVNAKQLQAR